MPISEGSEFGIMEVTADYQITAFYEKPANPPPIPGDPSNALASMGIYIFNADYLFKLLEEDNNTQAPAMISVKTSSRNSPQEKSSGRIRLISLVSLPMLNYRLIGAMSGHWTPTGGLISIWRQ